jgi:toxin CcdB
MARFDVYRLKSGKAYVIDCQADVLSHLKTRFVVPLMPLEHAPRQAERLNPRFDVEGRPVVMLTQFASAVACAELGDQVMSLAQHDHAIMNALDMLLTGF